MQRLFSVGFLLIVLLPLFGNLATDTTVAAHDQSPMRSPSVAKLLPADQNTTLITSTSTNSTSSTLSSITSSTATSSTRTTSSTTTITSTTTTSGITGSTQTTTSSSSLVSSTTTGPAASIQTTTTANLDPNDPVTVPSISLNPVSGSAGATVQVSGSDFSKNDTTCSVLSKAAVSQTCSISNGALTSTAFTVASIARGSYAVTVTSAPSHNSASAQFTVNATSPSITLSPTSSQVGAPIQVSGSGFLTSDTTCSLSGSPVASSTCSISNGMLTATFTVASIATGAYSITAYGKPGGDSASAQLTVSAAPSMSSYSISFSPPYWFCTDSYVTFTGPLMKSGYYGDTLQFQYYQYDPTLPSAQNLIFIDGPLTVTSDTVSYWIRYPEYAPVNFAYMPYIAVKVIDLTPKSNGNVPGLIFMQLTTLTPQGAQSCPDPSSINTPEFQFQWLAIVAPIAICSLLIQGHSARRGSTHERNKKESPGPEQKNEP